MAEEKIYVTEKGLKDLQNELEHLTKTRRKEVAEDLQRTRELGDISENAAYEAARNEQSFIEGRIEELEELLKRTELIGDGEGKALVGIGTRVKLHLDGDDQEFHIVGIAETDPESGRISHKSPLGTALMGKKVGDRVAVEAPAGKITYKILEIK
jgi:transcription elongation factor GreA